MGVKVVIVRLYFLKEEYYIQEIDLSNFFCFGFGPNSDEYGQC